jgi:hypothetical protein
MKKPLIVLVGFAVALGAQRPAVSAPPSPDRVASVIEAFLRFAVEGQDLPADPPRPAPAFPDRRCGGQLDTERPSQTVYVSWQISGEGQHALCNWRYDVASHHATPLTTAEAASVADRISAGSIHPQERAFFHSVPQRGDRLAVTAGYCWGSASGTFAFRADGPVLIGDLAIHGY